MATKGKSTVGWFFGFKLHLVVNDKGEIMSFDYSNFFYSCSIFKKNSYLCKGILNMLIIYKLLIIKHRKCFKKLKYGKPKSIFDSKP